ncbi:MAG: phenylalanine--tRNA ligase subunit beta [Clostridia bacterium]|nr:phenylalanine--tRNA ligase subunit beta [Clostridia bacterium]
MKAPISWLKDYVDIDVDINTLEERLVSIGFEVEDIIDFSDKFSGVVVCEILSIDKHPNADKLSVCEVDIGEKQLQIVTNAKNIRVGDKVPVALDGAVLSDGTHIKDGELRGVKSKGMFCGGEELGANDSVYPNASFDGVLVLDSNERIGESMINVLGFDDAVLDINITANRPDCNSIYGVAREVAVALGKKCKPLDCSYIVNGIQNTANMVTVEVVDSDLCPNYFMQGVTDVTVKPSPLWMTRRLFKVGLHGISNIVDITNYVLFELGQPMHAFDHDNIKDRTIIVRRALSGEKIIPLDEKEYVLDKDILVIADKSKPVGLAGIMGGLNSGISQATSTVVFESAVFKKENIRKSAKKLGLRSDSSARFEKGVESYTADMALSRALHLIQLLNCGIVTAGRIAIGEEIHSERQVSFKYSRISKILGISIDENLSSKILESLNIRTSITDGVINCIVPPYRQDIDKDCDIIEEIIRVYGYDNIQSTLLENVKVTVGGINVSHKEQFAVRDILAGAGYNEIITYSFGNKNAYTKMLFNDKYKDNLIRINNPLGEDMAYLRATLACNMLNTIAFNLSKKNKDFALYEFGRCFFAKSLPLIEQPKEITMLCMSITGENSNFFCLKKAVDLVLAHFMLPYKIKRSELCYLHPGKSADIILANGEVIGSFGELHPTVLDYFDIRSTVSICELNFDRLIALSAADSFKFHRISKYPSSKRDFAFVIDSKISVGDILETVKDISPLIESIDLFDIYNGGGLSAINKKSVAFSITLTSYDATLKDSEIDNVSDSIVEELRKKFGAKLRDN